MDLQDSCELLLRIEQEVDVNTMFYEGAHLWPLVRQFIWVNSIQRRSVPSEKKSIGLVQDEVISRKNPTYLDHLQHVVTNSKMAHVFKRSLKVAQQKCSFSSISADICFLSQPIYYSETLNGRPYSRIIDPIYEILSAQFSCLKLEERGGGHCLPQREYSCKTFNALPLKTGVNIRVMETIQQYEKVLNEISHIARIGVTELVQGLTFGLLTAVRYRDTYSLLLEEIQPKMFFLASYYFPSFMGLNWAASINNIPTIDLQHGKQGKFQGMYSHWTKIPEEGYALLPTWFWSWGRPSMENIMKWQRDRNAHHCIVGGYPWISRWKSNDSLNTQVELPDAEKFILITTQAPVGGLDNFFPDMLADAIQRAPENWCWIVREHPNYKPGNSVIKEKLKGIDENRYEVDTYNKAPLYSLLERCDFHITAYSSVCYEAEAFNVPTAIFSEVGWLMYKQEIEAGNFIYCDDGESLVNAISNFKAEKNKVEYIESSAHIVCSALQIIGNKSGLNVANLEQEHYVNV